MGYYVEEVGDMSFDEIKNKTIEENDLYKGCLLYTSEGMLTIYLEQLQLILKNVNLKHMIEQELLLKDT